MIVVGNNLRKLVDRHHLIDDLNSFDEQSLTLNLSRDVVRIAEPSKGTCLTYGHDVPDDWLKEESLSGSGLLMAPKDCVLACSRQVVHIPLGYFGFIQTKGSLARMFVSAQAADGQVEAGYKGRVTFELVNHAPYSVCIPVDAPVAQMFIFRATTREYKPYSGRYNEAEKPTVSRAPF